MINFGRLQHFNYDSAAFTTKVCFQRLRTPREEIAFNARPKIYSHSQIFWYGRSIFCLPHWPNFSDNFDLCLHWESLVRACFHLHCESNSQIYNSVFICFSGHILHKSKKTSVQLYHTSNNASRILNQKTANHRKFGKMQILYMYLNTFLNIYRFIFSVDCHFDFIYSWPNVVPLFD